MRKKITSIPVNTMTGDFGGAIFIERIAVSDTRKREQASFYDFEEEAEQSHRHDRHSFFLLERGSVQLEIDFKKYTMKAPSVIYIHPDQVHRTTGFHRAVVCSWAMSNEKLNPGYLEWLKDSTPAKPLALNTETFSLMSQAVALALKLAERTNDKLYHSSLKDSCNALVALVTSLYLAETKSTDKLSRFEVVTKAFRELLELNYTIDKRPAEYARKLNLSTPYLNECVKHTTGYPVTYHIQQRIILEGKRLLYHSSRSVKEIAGELGYEDYPYFSRLFVKVMGMTAITFRNKNRD